MKSLVLAVWLLGAYFDAHNHFTGILPYQAYANLPAYVRSLSNPGQGVTERDKLALYSAIANDWYEKEREKLGTQRFSPPDGQRFALGARAALDVFGGRVATEPGVLDGVLERVLSATPWTEFDSAYAFRGAVATPYLLKRFYGGDSIAMENDFCRATILDLARTNIQISEQSLPWIGGWHYENGRSDRMHAIECPSWAATDPTVVQTLKAMNRPMPEVRFVLMTHTSQLGTLDDGTSYLEWSKIGRCAAVPLHKFLVTTPKQVQSALADDPKIYDAVVGIDTAGPETTCFTRAGMAYFEMLAAAVYDAAKTRRAAGWKGKLLVHTHVGEGGVIDFQPPPPKPWTFAGIFSKLPPTSSNAAQATENISMLLGAIDRFMHTHPDASQYVIFRLAHATWATPKQAAAMRELGVEADVNLESNVATGAYPVSRMPLGLPLIMRYWIDPEAANERTNFALNDLLRSLVSDPSNVRQTGAILGDAALKYLLEARVRCLLGTDADGVEHSDIVREYRYAGSLIAYWKQTDPQFRQVAGAVTVDTLQSNVRWHLDNMASDKAVTY